MPAAGRADSRLSRARLVGQPACLPKRRQVDLQFRTYGQVDLDVKFIFSFLSLLFDRDVLDDIDRVQRSGESYPWQALRNRRNYRFSAVPNFQVAGCM